ncbi:spore coat associated protein CotJA [Paenibacillus thiaminolyticus]|nr:cotja protein [Paenibacillus thiaminolyticus]
MENEQARGWAEPAAMPSACGPGAHSQERYYIPFRGPWDPCPPLPYKTYVVPPNLFITFQPPNLPQFPPPQALRCGTLWPALFSPYRPKGRREEGTA